MKKIYMAVALAVFFTGCELEDNSSAYSYEETITNPYTKNISDGYIDPTTLNLLEDYDSKEYDTIKYITDYRLKATSIVNNMRALPIACNDDTANSGKANCITWSSALANAAEGNTNTIASLDDATYTEKTPKELASLSGYSGDEVKKASLSFYFDSDDDNRVLTKVIEEALKSSDGSCSLLMDKDMIDYGISYTTKEVDGKKKVYATIMMGK